jgi:hypothetical protein
MIICIVLVSLMFAVAALFVMSLTNDSEDVVVNCKSYYSDFYIDNDGIVNYIKHIDTRA